MSRNTKTTLPAVSGTQALLAEQATLASAAIRRVTRARPGQPTKRSPEVIEEMLDRMRCGESLLSVCQDAHMPGYSTVMRWQSSDDELLAQFDRAAEFGARTIDEANEEIARGGILSTGDFRRDELLIKVNHWRMGKMNRRRFGEKVQHDHIVHEPFVIEGTMLPNDTDDGF